VTTVTATLSAGTAVDLSSAGHNWRADEPAEAGGTDSGPTPYDLLLGALASCTCITVSLYAARRGIALAGVTARFEHDRVHRQDCEEDPAGSTGFIERVNGEVVITAEADGEQRRRLAQVASRCPVRRTLEGHIQFADVVRFAEPSA
jgi:putative redox protein